MTVREFVESRRVGGINYWLAEIEKHGFSEHEKLVLACAEEYGKITINHKANFI